MADSEWSQQEIDPSVDTNAYFLELSQTLLLGKLDGTFAE